jgi:hypothetical protein
MVEAAGGDPGPIAAAGVADDVGDGTGLCPHAASVVRLRTVIAARTND